MFGGAVNQYDDLVVKATDENLSSENWDVNLQICDKVADEGTAGARNAINALQKRLAHRNPNVQIYALENCGKTLHAEMSSRAWTGALNRLINDRTTQKPVQRKALGYTKEWAQKFEESGDPNLALMGELYDELRGKNFKFGDEEPAPEADPADVRRQQEEEELARVIELSKQDSAGRPGAAQNPYGNAQPSYQQQQELRQQQQQNQPPQQQQQRPPPPQQQQHQQQQQPPQQHSYHVPPQQAYGQPVPNAMFGAPAPQAQSQVPPPPPKEPAVPDLSTATRVRAIYDFQPEDIAELNFAKGDIIKVLDRGFDEWWRGASNGKIGIFPVTYVEAVPEPSPAELLEEQQEESRLFSSIVVVDKLLEMLKAIDPQRGARIQDDPQVEELYQNSVVLQPQINALIKKYSDQKAELEYMNDNFLRAMRQYETLRAGGAPAHPGQAQYQAPYPPGQSPHDPYAQQGQYAQQQQQQQQQPQPYQHLQPQGGHPPQESPQLQQGVPQWPPQQQQQPQQPYGLQDQHGGYYQQQQQHAGSTTSLPSGAPGYPPAGPVRNDSGPGAAGVGAGESGAAEHAAAWDAYYRAQGQQPPGQHGAPPQPQPQAQGYPQQVPYGGPQTRDGVDGVAAGVQGLSVGQ